MDAPKGRVQAFAEAMARRDAAPYTVLRRTDRLHAVRDTASEMLGYVVSNKEAQFPGEQPVQSVNQPCFLMVHPEGNDLALSIASTERGLMGKTPFVLVLKGEFSLKAAEDGMACKVENGVTTVQLPFVDFLPVRVTLVGRRGDDG